jgi:hypothetical protein
MSPPSTRPNKYTVKQVLTYPYPKGLYNTLFKNVVLNQSELERWSLTVIDTLVLYL